MRVLRTKRLEVATNVIAGSSLVQVSTALQTGLYCNKTYATVQSIARQGEVFLTRPSELTIDSILDIKDEKKAIDFLQENCLKDSSVTIVLLGRRTWNSKWVDWEVAATLAAPEPSSLMGIYLPSVASGWAPVPSRLADNSSYAEVDKYPPTPVHLAKAINAAAENNEPVNNERHLLGFNFTR